tara:strand:+ start:2999 stop:3229 length:231 start_codon:yes stop_codon:yes gene_type:complete
MSIESDKLIEDKIKAMNDIANGKMSSNIKSSSKSHLQGAIIGGIIGLVGAIALRSKPLYGVVIGSILGRVIVKKIK